MPSSKTSGQILTIAQDILATGGLGALSFDAIAQELGKSKQAVLYWYPTKQDLLAALFLPWLEAEAEAATASVAGMSGRSEAIAAFVRALAGFHLADLDRFRMMYVVPQTIKSSGQAGQATQLTQKVHPVTDRVYGALAAHLGDDPLAARREAVAIHAAVLGVLLMFGLADSLGDPLKHSQEALIEALIVSFTGP